MKFNEIIDPLYGKIQLPSFIKKLLLCPEILRLKEIRMSNINFFNFTGFSDSSRYEHAVGTAYLASETTKRWDIDQKDRFELITAALFHDVATPPFGHVTEAVYKQEFHFDHEEETAKIVLGKMSEFRKTDIGPIYAGDVRKLREIYEKTSNPKLDIRNVFIYIQGKGKFGKIIKGKIDLDNIDNVIRSAYHIGLRVDKNLPLDLARSFFCGRHGRVSFRFEGGHLIRKWLGVRNDLYTHLLLNTNDLNRESILKYAIKKAAKLNILKRTDWLWTDNEVLCRLTDPKRLRSGKYNDIPELINRVRLGIYFREIGLYWISDPEFYSQLQGGNHLLNKIETELCNLLRAEVVINAVPDKRGRRIDDFGLAVEGPLFQFLLPEKENMTVFGEESKNVLLGAYSVRPTIVKRDVKGKTALDENSKQMKYKSTELRLFVLDLLRKYLGNPVHISIFHPKLIEPG